MSSQNKFRKARIKLRSQSFTFKEIGSNFGHITASNEFYCCSVHHNYIYNTFYASREF